jgi:ParB family chromosome partitioning protein
MSKSRGLGRGLDALLKMDSTIDESKDEIKKIRLSDIVANKFQPRKNFDDEAMEELKESIKAYGVLQPILVRKTMNGYELVAGERRFRASKLAGIEEIPAIVRDYNDTEITEIALIENLQREDLNPIEEAAAYDRLLKNFNLTQEVLSKRVGKSRSHIANFIRMLSLPKKIQDFVSRETISMGQAKPLLSLLNEEAQLEAAEYIIEEDLSARECEELVKLLKEKPNYIRQLRQSKENKSLREADSNAAEHKENVFIRSIEEKLRLALGTQVKIKAGKKKSKIEIEFYSDEELERLLELIEKSDAAKADDSIARLTV